jgi:hypothetical protein
MRRTLEVSKSGARRRSTVDKLVAALELHMENEERDIYPVGRKGSSTKRKPSKPPSSTAWPVKACSSSRSWSTSSFTSSATVSPRPRDPGDVARRNTWRRCGPDAER